MGATLDLDDVAATSETAQKELAELREAIGEATNPRHLLWRVWHGDNPSLRMWDYTAWIGQRWTDWCTEHQRARHAGKSTQDHAEFDAWLRRWVRREIAPCAADEIERLRAELDAEIKRRFAGNESASAEYREDMGDLQAKIFRLEQTIDAGRRLAAQAHDALLRGDSDAEILAYLSSSYGPTPNAEITGRASGPG